MRASAPPPARTPLRLWATIGWSSFGGPAAQIALLHREFVERRGWVTEAEFQRALSVCMLLPGPEALQLAIFLGWRLNGRRGACVAGLCFLLPAVAVLLGLSLAYAYGSHLPVVVGVLRGLAATVVALIGHALVRLARRGLDAPVYWVIAVATFAALVLTRLPYPLLMGTSALVALVAAPRMRAGPAAPAPAPLPRATWAAASPIAAGLFAWAMPLLALVAAGVRGVPLRLYVFLTKASLLTFGGAYAIVKYVSDALVRDEHLITADQAVAGLALAETTPGPLMIVLQFFGFAAGWNDGSIVGRAWTGVLCSLLATWASFLPSFVLVLAVAPHVDRIAGVPALSGMLRGVMAFVVGVIASLGFTVAATALIDPLTRAPSWPAVAITVAAAWLLSRPRVALHWVLAFGALAGFCIQRAAA